MGSQNGGRYRLVVAIRRWSLAQAWLYILHIKCKIKTQIDWQFSQRNIQFYVISIEPCSDMLHEDVRYPAVPDSLGFPVKKGFPFDVTYNQTRKDVNIFVRSFM